MSDFNEHKDLPQKDRKAEETIKMNGMSRRNFLKITTASAAGVMAASFLNGCSSKPAAPAGEGVKEASKAATSVAKKPNVKMSFSKPGTYEATRHGNASDITIQSTFTKDKLTEIRVLKQGETPALFEKVEKELIPEMIEYQAGGVDVITGATNSSNAVKEAVADTVKQAGGDEKAWLSNTVQKNPGPDENYEADVVVVGSGASGFMAAVSAAKEGAKVIVLEKGSSVAAVNGIKVSGPFGVGTRTLEERGTTLTVDDAFYHVMNYSHWTPNPPLAKKCLETSKDSINLLNDLGYQFKEANFRFETPFKDEKGGFHLILNKVEERVEIWNKAYADNKVQAIFDTTAKKIIKNGEKIEGVEAEKKDGTKVTVKAKAVIIASGGYLGNRDMQQRYLGTRKLNAAAGGNSLCTGDGINMALEAGAGLEKTFGYCPCEYGGTNSKASRPAKQDKYDQNYMFKFGLYGSLLVDGEGERFINEGLLCDYPMSYGSEQILRNSPWYSVVDHDFVEAMRTEGLYEFMTKRGANSENWFIGNYFKGRILDKLPSDIEEGIKEGWMVKADTIKEAGEKFGLTNLEATVEKYNKFCDEGKDPEFGANPWYLVPVKTPPFYVVENEPSAWSTFGGIKINEHCRVLTVDNHPIPGLYAVGTDAGSLMYSPYYDIPGYCYGLCIDSGYIAGKDAAAFAKK